MLESYITIYLCIKHSALCHFIFLNQKILVHPAYTMDSIAETGNIKDYDKLTNKTMCYKECVTAKKNN